MTNQFKKTLEVGDIHFLNKFDILSSEILTN